MEVDGLVSLRVCKREERERAEEEREGARGKGEVEERVRRTGTPELRDEDKVVLGRLGRWDWRPGVVPSRT
jgi:hypothetical protein